MLRFNLLAVMCLGLLVSCGPAKSEGSASKDPHGRTSPARTTVTQSVTAAASNLAVSPTSLDLGEQRLGTSSTPQTVTVSNIGTEPVRITEISLTPGTPFTVSPNAAFELAAGASTQLAVTFSPTTQGATSATLTLSTDETTPSTASVSLSGTGVSYPELKLDRSSSFFGDVKVGSVSVKVPVTVSNTGTAEVTLQSLPVEGPFAISLPTGATLPKTISVGDSFTFDVTFNPAVQGAANGSVSILSDTVSPLKVSLSGNGIIAVISLSQTALDFGKQRVMETSGVQPVFITNTGSADLELTELIFSNSAFAISAPLPLPSPGSPLRIAPGAQKAVSVAFTPATLGLVSGKLYIVSNAFTPAPPLELTGEGVDGQLSLTPGVASFAGVDVGGSGVQQSVVLTNTGGHPLTITSVSLPEETSFTVSGLTPGLVLKPGEQWPFTVTFAPVRRGYLTSTFAIKSDARTSPALDLALSGTGMAAAVELLPQNIHFGKSNVGVPTPQDMAIKNVGERDLYVSNISFADAPSGIAGAALDFSVGGTVLFQLVVKPGESKLVPLQFTPRAVGLRQARAIVHTNDKAAEVNLLGEGTSPTLALSSSSLDFGDVRVGRPSTPHALELTNTGTGPLTLRAMALGGADATAFILAPPTLPLTLQPGASSEVWVSLKPDAERPFSAHLVVESNDTGSPSVAVPMSGAGVYQQLQLSESSLELGQQLIHHTSNPRKVRVTNTSDSDVTLTALAVEGAGASQFTLEKLPLPLLLAPGQGQEVGVTFTPLAEAEAKGTLKLTFSGLPRPLEVALHGTGIPAVLSIRPSPLDFGGVLVGSSRREQPLTLTNLSSDPIVLAAPVVTSQTGTPFSLDMANLQGRTLEPGMSVIMTVGYQPTTTETLSETTLSFGTTTPSEPLSMDVQLKGQALKQLLFVDSGSLNFGQVEVGKPMAPKVVTLINRSSLPQWVVVKLKDLESSPFTLEAKALADPIPPGGSASIKVGFQPVAEGEVQNEVQVWLQGNTTAEALIPVMGSGHINTETGGCSSGSTEVGSAGLLAMLMLVGLGSRRRGRG